MKFGVREICDVVFKALQGGKFGGMDVVKGQPVLYIDSAKTSTIEGAASTSYATGGRGNSRLIAWEGEKTLTFTVEDALLSPIGFAVLSGAGLFKPQNGEKAYVHTTSVASVYGSGSNKYADLGLETDETISSNAPVFVMEYNDGSIGTLISNCTVEDGKIKFNGNIAATQVFVDFYVEKFTNVTELQIDAENFAGYYYVEASTLFRRESDGKDLPAEIVFPKVKIQSNFTFTMAPTGDPSTFTFTMDALPAYTMFNKDKKVLCAMQVIDDTISIANSTPVTMNDNGYVDSDVVQADSENVTKYTVTYKIGGVTVASETVRKGGKATAPRFEVEKWYDSSEEYDFESPVNANLTLSNEVAEE